jgi:hypothetical protein
VLLAAGVRWQTAVILSRVNRTVADVELLQSLLQRMNNRWHFRLAKKLNLTGSSIVVVVVAVLR